MHLTWKAEHGRLENLQGTPFQTGGAKPMNSRVRLKHYRKGVSRLSRLINGLLAWGSYAPLDFWLVCGIGRLRMAMNRSDCESE